MPCVLASTLTQRTRPMHSSNISIYVNDVLLCTGYMNDSEIDVFLGRMRAKGITSITVREQIDV